jgi:hypothetical protein
MTLAMFGRCEQSGYNLATIRPTIQLIFAIKQGLRPCSVGIIISDCSDCTAKIE